MLGRYYHVCSAEQRVGTGGIYHDRLARRRLKGDLRTGGTADPVDLLCTHAIGIIYELQIVDQALCIRGDLKHPLALDLAHDLAAATLAYAADDFFVSKHALAGGTPVDRHFLFVGQPLLEQL